MRARPFQLTLRRDVTLNWGLGFAQSHSKSTTGMLTTQYKALSYREKKWLSNNHGTRNQIFGRPSLICLVGNSTTPPWRNALTRSSQQLFPALSQTLEGLFEMTRRPSNALILASFVSSGTKEIQKRLQVWCTEVQERHQKEQLMFIL